MMSYKEKRALKMKGNSYVLVSRTLFNTNYDGVLLRCFHVEKNHEILRKFMKEYVEANFPPNDIAHWIIGYGYYWLTIFKDSYSFIRKRLTCQKNSGRMKRVAMPL